MSPFNCHRLAVGQFHGTVLRTRTINGIRLTEDVYPRDLRVPRHSHELAYFSFVIEGSYKECVGNQIRDCGAGTAVFHPACETHSDQFQTAGGRILSIEISPDWSHRLNDDNCDMAVPKTFYRGSVSKTALRLLREFRTPDHFSAIAIEGLALQLFVELGRHSIHSNSGRTRWMKIVLEILNEEFDQEMNLDLIASRAGVHPVHLAREFRKHHRCTVGEYIRRVRIDAACQRLSHSDEPISEIAMQTGFFDQSHLTRTFKMLIGNTPAEYRKQTRGR